MPVVGSVFLPLVRGGRTTAAGVGSDYVRATDYPSLQAAADAAAQLPARRLYMPAGVYTDPHTSGDILALASDMDVWGDGEEKTILNLPPNPTGNIFGIRLYGPRARVAGLSVHGAQVGAFNQYGVSATFGAEGWRLSDLTVSGVTGMAQAGGVAFDFYQPSTVNGGWHNGAAERLTARENGSACGMVVNSQGNTFRDCVFVANGATSYQHNVYVQGGGNAFDRCSAERASGYNWHNYAAVPDRLASHNVYHACTSVDPLGAHFIATSVAAGATNPDVPAGTPLNRGVMLDACTFRRTKNGPAGGGLGFSVPASIVGCTFEDVMGSAGAWIGASSGGARLLGNLFRMTATPPNVNIYGIVCAGGAIVAENQFINWLIGTAIRADGLALINDNVLDLFGGIGIHTNGADVRTRNNVCSLHGSAKATYGSVVTA